MLTQANMREETQGVILGGGGGGRLAVAPAIQGPGGGGGGSSFWNFLGTFWKKRQQQHGSTRGWLLRNGRERYRGRAYGTVVFGIDLGHGA